MLASIVSLAAEFGTVSLVDNALKAFKSCPKKHPILAACQGVAILFIGMAASDKVGKYAETKTEEIVKKIKSFVDDIHVEVVKPETEDETLEPEMEDEEIASEFDEVKIKDVDGNTIYYNVAK